jgi:hypothetical protein
MQKKGLRMTPGFLVLPSDGRQRHGRNSISRTPTSTGPKPVLILRETGITGVIVRVINPMTVCLTHVVRPAKDIKDIQQALNSQSTDILNFYHDFWTIINIC